jgi:hypothetical protein
VGSLSVENDFGRAGRAGTGEALEAAAFGFHREVGGRSGGLVDELKRPLNGRLDFFVRTRACGLGGSGTTFRDLDSSGMRTAPVSDLRLLVSEATVFFFESSFTGLLDSFVGEDEREGDDIHDFLLNLDNDRTGDNDFGESVCFTVSGRLRSGFGSADGSLLFDVNDSNLDDRREFVGRNWGICIGWGWGSSSEDGLDPPEEVYGDSPSWAPDFKSSSEIVPFSSSSVGSARSLTRGK